MPNRELLKPKQHCRILGIIFDSKLNWDEHIKHIQKQATKSFGALTSLAGSTWGIGYTRLWQIYTAVIIPQLLYGCSVWYAPTAEDSNYRVTKIRKLTSIQYRAARIITGAFKATSGLALDVEAFLMPMEQ